MTKEFDQLTAEDLENMAREMRANAAGSPVYPDLDKVERVLSHPSSPQSRPAAEVWGSNEFDFTCPSGATCRMRKLMPEKLLETGILDKITSLPGIVAGVVERSEGQMPRKEDLPSKEDLAQVVAILELLIPMVVVEPPVFPVPVYGEDGVLPERVSGRIYTDSIELQDRIAIMERAVQGVKKLEPFREGSGTTV